jgi:VWFA-related protein
MKNARSFAFGLFMVSCAASALTLAQPQPQAQVQRQMQLLAQTRPQKQRHAQIATPSQTSAGEKPAFESGATAVLVDVVVRDKHGVPVTDLDARDFEIREDGVRQRLGSFTRVSRGAGIAINVGRKQPDTLTVVTPPSSSNTNANGDRDDNTPSVTALVFDALSAEAMAMCQKAAGGYLPMSGTMQAQVGVFVTEPTVHALQMYTDNPALVRHAVQRLQPTSTVAKETQQERIDNLNERRDQLEEFAQTTESNRAAPAAPGQSGPGGNIGQLEMERRFVRAQLQMAQAFDTLDRDHRGYGTTAALFAVVQSLVMMPGRKTVVFFSEGLPASPSLQARLQAVIEAANRSNVSVYAVDATGLRAVSEMHDVRKQIEQTGKERMRQLGTRDALADEPLTRMVERNEDLLKFDSQGGLARLSQDTGGILVRDTNDLHQAFRRIDEDMRFHYLLTYAPANQTFDGKFRQIDVKVARGGVDVFARKGYRALRTVPAAPVLDFEAPALAALDAPKLPNAFPFPTGVFSFPEPGHPGHSPLVVRLTTDNLTYERDTGKDIYSGEADVVVRFKNVAGEVVHKVSQQYHLTGRLGELDAARQGEILFYRQPDLAPGVYTVEAIVYDVFGSRASAKVSTLEIARPSADHARLSSVLLVRKAEHVKGAPDTRVNASEALNPLYVGDVVLYPNAGEPYSRAQDHELTFYYTVYPRKGAAAAAELALRHNGQTIARIPVALGAADTQGRIQQLSRLPLASLADGTYQLSIVIHDGAHSIERSTFFRVTS